MNRSQINEPAEQGKNINIKNRIFKSIKIYLILLLYRENCVPLYEFIEDLTKIFVIYFLNTFQ